MNSLGQSSKWPSYDSLPSTSSFFHSETEDEADVFSEGEGDCGMRKRSVDEGITLSGNYLKFPGRSDQPISRCKIEQPGRCAVITKHPGSASCPGTATLGSSSATPGDLAFAKKCADLQRFIHPLLELRQGLKMGRFDKGLSSFQQSVAIDRLQRILGILQRPEMGEKYLQNLLQIEMMLKIWFPRVPLRSTEPPRQTTSPRQKPHWRQSQLHMPVKKRKLSWYDPEHSGPLPTKHRHQHWSGQDATSHITVSTRLPGSHEIQKTTLVAASRHEFTDSTGTLSMLSHSCSTRENKNPCGSPAAQDSSVSSSDAVSRTRLSWCTLTLLTQGDATACQTK